MGYLEEILDIEGRSSDAIIFAETCLTDIKETEDLARVFVQEIMRLQGVQRAWYQFLSPSSARVHVIIPTLGPTWKENDPRDSINVVKAMRDQLLNSNGHNNPHDRRLQLWIQQSEGTNGYKEGIGI